MPAQVATKSVLRETSSPESVEVSKFPHQQHNHHRPCRRSISSSTTSANHITQGGALADRRCRREARSRPWLSGSSSSVTRGTGTSPSTSPVLVATSRVQSSADQTTAAAEGKGRDVPRAPVSRLAMPAGTSDVKAPVRHTQEAAFAGGSRLPRLANGSCSVVSAKPAEVAEEKKKERASSAAGVSKARSLPIPSVSVAGAQRVERVSAPKPDG